MPEILTFSELDQLNKKYLAESHQIFKAQVFNEAKAKTTQKNVFLSYSSKDSHHLPFIVKVIEGHGGTPYIDIGDNRLPKPPSVETAKILKNAIVGCKRLVVFVTTNSKDSKWIPWELGIGDGAKSNYDIALFPAADNVNNTIWLEQEYLGLYSRIEWGKLQGHAKEVWMVFNPHRNNAIELSEWIKQ